MTKMYIHVCPVVIKTAKNNSGKMNATAVCIWAVGVTDPSQALLYEVQLFSGVNGQQVRSHHLTGQRDGVPVKGLLRQQVLSSTVKHPGLALCGQARRTIIIQIFKYYNFKYADVYNRWVHSSNCWLTDAVSHLTMPFLNEEIDFVHSDVLKTHCVKHVTPLLLQTHSQLTDSRNAEEFSSVILGFSQHAECRIPG